MAHVYETMIKLSLVENVGQGLARVISLLATGDRHAKELEKSLLRLAPAAIGAVTAFAGFEVLKGIWDVAKASKELLNQQDKMERLGRSHLSVLQLTEKYYKDIGRAIPTASADAYLKTIYELRAVTGDWRRAEQLAPKALMVDELLANIAGKTGETSKSGQYTEFYKLMRSAEMKGISTDETKLNKYTDKVFSLIQAFGGKLQAGDFQLLARRGGTAFINTDIDKALGAVAAMAADLGGQTAGNALMSLYALQQGSAVLSKQQYHTLRAAGMIDPAHVIQQGFGKVQTKPGAITGGLDYAGNLPGWAHDVLRPHLMAYAEKVGDPGLVNEFFQSFWAKIIPNRKAAQAASMFSEPGFVMQQQKDLELARQGKTIEGGYAAALQRNPDIVQEAFSAQYKSMTEAIGSPVMMSAIPIMNSVRDMFTAIGAFAIAHPEAIGLIAKVTAGVAALAVVLGTFAVGAGIFALLPGGAIVVGIAALTAGLVGLIAFRWDELSTELSRVGDGFKSLYEKIRAYFGGSYETKNPTLKPESNSVFGTLFDMWAKRFNETQGTGEPAAPKGWVRKGGGWSPISGEAGDIPWMRPYLNSSDPGSATEGTALEQLRVLKELSGGAGGGLGGGSSGASSGGGSGGASGGTSGPGSRSFRNNNPGNIKYGEFAKAHGATGQDSGGFAIFQNEAAGTMAQGALWASDKYANLPLDKALKQWSGGGYTAAQLGFSGSQTFAGLSHGDQEKLMAAQRTREGWMASGATGHAPGPSGSTNPSWYGGKISVGGHTYDFATGGNVPGFPATPPGDYSLIGGFDPSARHGKGGFHVSDYFQKGLGRTRSGVEIHESAKNNLDQIRTLGCLAVPASEWPAFKRALSVDMAEHGGRGSLHIDKSGNASITHGPPPKQHESAIHNHIYLDGKHIATNVIKHVVRAAKYAGSVGRQDGRGQFMGPSAERFA